MLDVGGYLHAAVSEGKRVGVAGQALLLAVVGAGGRRHGVTRVDVVRVNGLSTGRVPGTTEFDFTLLERVLFSIYRHRRAEVRPVWVGLRDTLTLLR